MTQTLQTPEPLQAVPRPEVVRSSLSTTVRHLEQLRQLLKLSERVHGKPAQGEGVTCGR